MPVGLRFEQIREKALIRVDPDGLAGHSTIQAAIDSAAPSDVILIYPGSYNEKLTITKSISLIGLTQPHGRYNIAPRVVVQPTLTVASEIAVSISGNVSKVHFENILFSYEADIITGLTQGIAAISSINLDFSMKNCRVRPRVSLGSGGGQSIQGLFVGSVTQTLLENCNFAIDDPSTVITTGACTPVTIFGTSTEAWMSGCRVEDGIGGTCFGHLSLQTNAVLTMMGSAVEGELSDVGGTTTLNLDTPCLIGSLTSTGTINHRHTNGPFGREYHSAEVAAETSTTSTAWVEKLSLVTATLPIGTYVLYWSIEQNSDNKGISVQVEMDDGGTPGNGTQLAEAGTKEKVADVPYNTHSGTAELTFVSATTHRFDIDHRDTGTGPSTSTVRRARIQLWRIS